MTKDEALKLGLQLVETAEYLATDSAICGNYVKEERALIQQSKIAFEEALAQSDQESDDLTIAYMAGFHAGKNTPQRKLEQEPVAHQKWCASLTQLLLSMPPQPAPCNCHPPQRTWVGLTDEQYQNCAQAMDAEPLVEGWIELIKFARAIEAKLREKNT